MPRSVATLLPGGDPESNERGQQQHRVGNGEHPVAQQPAVCRKPE